MNSDVIGSASYGCSLPDLNGNSDNNAVVNGNSTSYEKWDVLVDTGHKIAVRYILYLLKENYGISEDFIQELQQRQQQHHQQQQQQQQHQQQQYAENIHQENSELDTCIENMCNEIRDKNSIFFENIIANLNVTENNARAIFMGVGRKIYENGINWGRILTLYAFAGTFAIYFAKNGKLRLVEQIPIWVSEIFESCLVIWMLQNGGWKSLKTHYGYTVSPRSSKTLIGFGVVIGVAAAGIMFLR